MSAHSVRCPSCGKRLPSTARICPLCGTEQPQHVSRIRCNYCSRRIPANAALCPYCRRNPRRHYIRARWLLLPLALAGIVAVVFTALNAPVWFSALALNPAATATSAVAFNPTARVIVTVLPAATLTPTATASRLATSSAALVTTMSLLPSPTRMPTVESTAEPSPSPIAPVRPTATRTRRAPSPTPKPTATLTITATPFPPPVLLAPPDQAAIVGPRRFLWLSFRPSATLPEQGWYRIEVDFQDREDRPATWCGWTQGTGIYFPGDYRDDSWQFDRLFRWRVQVFHSQNVNIDPAGLKPFSPPSVERAFYCH